MKSHFLVTATAVTLLIASIIFLFSAIYVNSKYELVPKIWVGSFAVYVLIFVCGCFILWVPAQNLWYENEEDIHIVTRTRILFCLGIVCVLVLLGWSLWDMIVGVTRKEIVIGSGVVTKNIDYFSPIFLFMASLLLSLAFVAAYGIKIINVMIKDGLYNADNIFN